MANKKKSSVTTLRLPYKENRDKAEEILAALYQIAGAASAVTDMQEFYATLHHIVGKLMYAKSFYVTLYDAATGLLSSPYFADEAGDTPPPPTKIDSTNKSLRGYVLLKGKTLHISAAEIEDGKHRGKFEPMGTPTEDWIGVPLKMGDQTIGSLTVQSYQKGFRYHAQDVQLLEFVAQHIAVALTRARAIDETRQRNAELQIINSVQEGLASRLDMAAIYELVGEKIRVTFNAQVVSIDTFDRAAQLLHSRYYFEGGETLPAAPYPIYGFRKHVIENRQPLVINNDMGRWMVEYDNPVKIGLQPKSAIFVPMIAGDEAMGVISLQNNDLENIFTEADLRLLTTLANSMTVALENARLFDETQRLLDETEQRAQELGIINSVQAALAAKLDIQGIYEAVGDEIREIFHNVEMGIRIYDPKTNLISYPYIYENGQRISLDPWPLPERGFGPHVLRTRKSLIINENFAQEAEKYGSGHVPGTAQSKSLVVVPLVIGNQARGLIDLMDTEKEHAFKVSDVRLLETLANAMSIALENAHLFDETQHLLKETEQRAQELAIINSVQDGLASRLAIQEIYDLVGDRLRDVFHNMDVEIRIYEAKTNMVHNPYTYENGERIIIRSYLLPERGFVPYVLHTLENMVINENLVQEMEKYGSRIVTGTQMAKSLMMVPLVVNDRAHGLITISDMHHEHAFKESDVRLLQTLVNSMSVALENARLWEEEKKYRRALERELEIGREIQTGFLPETLPEVEGWEIAASLMSAREVAGDFYDAFELPDGTIGLVIADVCDKGVGAALYMTLFRSLIRATANLDYFEHGEDINSPHSSPERLKRAMLLTNNYIAETHGDSGMFATLFFGILDTTTGKLTYINGGHEPPLIVRSGVVRETLHKTGPAVGVVMDCHFGLLETHLDAGDTFFAFTDGVPDCSSPNGEFFGRERLLEILQRSDGSVPELVKNIQTELWQFIANATQFDDVTLLAMRRSSTKLM